VWIPCIKEIPRILIAIIIIIIIIIIDCARISLGSIIGDRG
jgi:hypothetical protein